MEHVRKIDIRPDWYMFMIDNKIEEKSAVEYLKKSYEYEIKAANIITSKFIQISEVKMTDKCSQNIIQIRKVELSDKHSIVIEDDLKLK